MDSHATLSSGGETPWNPQSLQQSSLSQQRHPPNPKRKGLCVLLTGIGIIVTIFGPLCGLLIQILVVHDFYKASGAIVTSAPLGQTLAIAHACSILLTTTVPLVLGPRAYGLASSWLMSSRAGDANRPTPLQ
jgi:hypothetical protein